MSSMVSVCEAKTLVAVVSSWGMSEWGSDPSASTSYLRRLCACTKRRTHFHESGCSDAQMHTLESLGLNHSTDGMCQLRRMRLARGYVTSESGDSLRLLVIMATNMLASHGDDSFDVRVSRKALKNGSSMGYGSPSTGITENFDGTSVYWLTYLALTRQHCGMDVPDWRTGLGWAITTPSRRRT